MLNFMLKVYNLIIISRSALFPCVMGRQGISGSALNVYILTSAGSRVKILRHVYLNTFAMPFD